MNIVFVSSEFPDSLYAPTGGIGTYAQNLVTGLTKFGHKVFLITNSPKNTKYISKNIKVINANIYEKYFRKLKNKLPFSIIKRLLNFIEYPLLFNLGVCLALAKLTKRSRIDIIEGNDFGGELFLFLLLIRKRPPVVIRLHTPSFIIQIYNNEPVNLFYKLMKLLEIYVLKQANSLYSPTINLNQLVTREIKKSTSIVIPYPFKSLYRSNKTRLNNMVLYVGKLQSKKGIFNLVSAVPRVIKKVPGTKFYFVGPDTLSGGVSVKSLLIDKCLKRKIINNVHFLPSISKQKLYELYKQSSVTVVPSKWENFPNVILEAMANGSSVIASRVGGISEIIKNNVNGVLINKTDAKELADKIISLLRRKKKRNKIGFEAQKTIRHNYNIKRITKLTIKYYLSVINKILSER